MLLQTITRYLEEAEDYIDVPHAKKRCRCVDGDGCVPLRPKCHDDDRERFFQHHPHPPSMGMSRLGIQDAGSTTCVMSRIRGCWRAGGSAPYRHSNTRQERTNSPPSHSTL